MILIVGSTASREYEAHIKLSEALQARGQSTILFKQDQFLEEECLTYGFDGHSKSRSIRIDQKHYPLEAFEGVLYLHPTLPRQLLEYEPKSHAHFISVQFRELRWAMFHLLSRKKWLNNPWKAIEAESKVFQLDCANSVGLEVPKTLITSDSGLVRQFWDGLRGNVIVKTLGVSPILDHVIYTNILTEAQKDDSRAISMCPAVYQERVEKAYELRITVVGDELFVTRINSQEDLGTCLDWRRKPQRSDHVVSMVVSDVPSHIREKIFLFMKMAGLRFGCIDLIVTPEGKYIFLEVNPNGQWYFVQLETGQRIAEKIADVLLS